MSSPEPGAGDVAIELDGKEVTLTPTLEACIAINKIAGGLNGVVGRISNLDLDTICAVVAAGLGVNPVLAKQIPKAVYNTGLLQLSGPCIDFVHIVANGGRPLVEEEGETVEDPLQPASVSESITDPS